MEKVEVYKTKDGSLFSDYTQARVHEEFIKYKPEIDAFIASDACKYNNCAHRKIVENTILAWIFWKEDGGSK
jgi:hypothetical protein